MPVFTSAFALAVEPAFVSLLISPIFPNDTERISHGAGLSEGRVRDDWLGPRFEWGPAFDPTSKVVANIAEKKSFRGFALGS